MSESLDQLLVLVKEELDAEEMDKVRIEELFKELRNKIENVLTDDSSSVEAKKTKLSMVNELLGHYEAEARKQRALIQDCLKKLFKGRRSLKEYQENT
jgi:siroheme synthase (precorrin-2 oxidase/ferrochelatase)